MIQSLDDALMLAAIAIALAGAPIVAVAAVAALSVLWTVAQILLLANEAPRLP